MQNSDRVSACADGVENMEVVDSDVGSSSPPKVKRGGRKDAVHPKSRSALETHPWANACTLLAALTVQGCILRSW